MARISGVDIPREKRVQISLTYIYGIGRTSALNICEATGVDPTTRVRDLSDDDGAWLLHLTFADPTNAAAVAEDTANCPHLVQLRSGRRLPGKARADNAKATTVSSVSYQCRRCPCRASTRKCLAAPTR